MFALNRRFPFFRKAVIAVFALPLMFAGGAFLGGLAQTQTVGEVGSIDIPRNEFVYRYQNALEEYRRATGSEEVSQAVQQRITDDVRSNLLSYYLMQAALKQKGVRAPDSAVAEEIRQNPEFQDEDGEFSLALYQEFVSDSRYYQERVRESIGRESVLRAMTPLPQDYVRGQIATFRRQERVIDEAIVPLSALTTVTLNVPIDDVNLYYQRNSREYQLREEAAFEYFVFSLDDFAAAVTVGSVAVQEAYDAYVAELTDLGRRQVSHIYIEDEGQAAEVAAQVQAAPEQFAELAAEYSEDAASAELGGELGIVADGDLPPAMNEALFTMTVGQVHAPVETDEGGFSILKLDAIITEPVQPFEQVRDDMTRRARREAARDDFDDTVDELRDLAPLEIGSLVSLAAVAGSSLTIAATVYRDAAENAHPFNDDTILPDIFDPLVVADKENSEPIPLTDDDYLFVRALRYQSAGVRPLAEVAEEITDLLRAGYVVSDLYRQLDELHAPSEETFTDSERYFGDDITPVTTVLETAQWEQTHTVALYDSGEEEEAALNSVADDEEAALDEVQVDDVALDRIFAADLSRGLPAYVFIPQEQEVRLFRIREIHENDATALDREVVDELLTDQMGRITGLGYLDALGGQYSYQFYNTPIVLGEGH